jgi:hypothetical protein
VKVKHLIKKLQGLNPEANVYFGEGSMDSKPADYLLIGTRLKREGHFMTNEEVNHQDPKLLDHIIKRYGTKSRGELHGEDILICNWNGKWS